MRHERRPRGAAARHRRMPPRRCIAHLERNVCSMPPSKRQRKAAGKAMQAVFAQEDPAMVRAAYHAAIDAISSFSHKSSTTFSFGSRSYPPVT